MTERKRTYRGFRQFVRMQANKNPHRTIDHNTWCGCALGEYLDGEPAGKERRVEKWAEANVPPLPFNILNHCALAHEVVPTYGKLHAWLTNS